MQRYKRLMSIVLTIAMIMSMVPFSTISASAEDFSGAFFEPQGGYPEGYGPDYAQNQTETAADQTASAGWSVGFTNPVSTPQSNTVSADAQDEAEDDTPRNDPDDDGRLRIRPVDGTLTLTIDGETEVASAVPAERSSVVKEEAMQSNLQKKLYLKEPKAEELYLDRLELEKVIGYYSTDWTVLNLVDEDGDRKSLEAVGGSYTVTVSGPAMSKYAGHHPVFALATLEWDEEGDIVDRDITVLETAPAGPASWSFTTDKLSTLLIVVPTNMPVDGNEENTEPPKTNIELTYVAGEGGTLSAGDRTGEAEIKVDVEPASPDVPAAVTAVADSGYAFINWTLEDGTFVSAGTQLTPTEVIPLLKGDVKLVANFELVDPEAVVEKPAVEETPKVKRDFATLTYRATKGGVISSEGEVVDLTKEYIHAIGVFANNNFGYTFRDWTDEDGNVVSTSVSLIPVLDEYSEDHTYTANFVNANGEVEEYADYAVTFLADDDVVAARIVKE